MLKSIMDEYKISQPLLYSCDHKINVWLVSHGNKQSKTQCLFDILSKEEKKRAVTINHPARKKAYISGHALLRYLLSSLNGTKITPEIWDVRHNIYGKPLIIPVQGLPQYTCSLSYTKDIVAILKKLHGHLAIFYYMLYFILKLQGVEFNFFESYKFGGVSGIQIPATVIFRVHIWHDVIYGAPSGCGVV